MKKLMLALLLMLHLGMIAGAEMNYVPMPTGCPPCQLDPK